jgi:hypothetical protein
LELKSIAEKFLMLNILKPKRKGHVNIRYSMSILLIINEMEDNFGLTKALLFTISILILILDKCVAKLLAEILFRIIWQNAF